MKIGFIEADYFSWISFIVIIFWLIAIFIAMSSSVLSYSESTTWNFVLLSAGLIAFLGVFFPLVIEKDLNNKINKSIDSKWKALRGQVEDSFKEISKELGKRNKDVGFIQDSLSSISSNLDDVLDYKTKVNLMRNMAWSIGFFFIAIIMGVLKILFAQQLGDFYRVGYAAFFIGLGYLIVVFFVWINFNKDNFKD